jgi:hypothetical protein
MYNAVDLPQRGTFLRDLVAELLCFVSIAEIECPGEQRRAKPFVASRHGQRYGAGLRREIPTARSGRHWTATQVARVLERTTVTPVWRAGSRI